MAKMHYEMQIFNYEMQIFKKGALYSVECKRCGCTLYSHEWFHVDHNERRDAMKAGTLRCDECFGPVDAATFRREQDSYAGWYSAPGYLDATPVEYDTNERRLRRTLRDLYGEDR